MVESVQQELTFSQYPEIENYFHKDISIFIKNNEGANDLWVATEKIHGTNFSFITDGVQLLHGKRTSYLKDTDSFMNFQIIAQKYDQKIKKLFEIIKQKMPEVTLIKVFGEFYGGSYPNVGLPEKKKSKPIQQGIYYCPELEFEAFDIFYEKKTLQDEIAKSIITYTDAIKFLEEAQIPCAQIVKQGTLKELMETLNADTFESQIYVKFGLPKIDNNLAEGFVLKPNIAGWFPDGERISIKLKNKKFDEISQSAKVKEVKAQIANTDLPEDQTQSLNKFLLYLNLNRLNGVVTKLKDEEIHYKGLVVSKLMQDAQKDFEKTENNDILKPFGTGKKIILAKAKNEAEKVYEEFMKNQQK